MSNHDPDPAEPDGAHGVPFGLPVLAELPELASALDDLRAADRAIARAVGRLLPLLDTGVVESTAGVDVAHFVSLVARRTGTDARMLATTVRTCRRLPALWHAFSAGRLSWAQTRALVLRLQRPNPLGDTELDGIVARAIDDAAGADPDAVGTRLGWALDALEPEASASEVAADDDGFLHLQPRLDGTGGRVYGELGPVPFALLDTTTAPTPMPAGRSTDPVGPTRDGFAVDGDPDDTRDAARTLGRARLAALTGILWAHTRRHQPSAATDEGVDNAVDGGVDDRRVDAGLAAAGPVLADLGASEAGVGLLLRAELDTLLGHATRHGQLLTTLAGGAMQVTPATARRLTDAGVRCRLIVTDHGHIVGVGRASRRPPGWLREALLAVHDTCTAPGCRRAALTAQLDHARPWAAGGHTDVANCGPLCGVDNRSKERAGWRATGRPDGRRRWHHPRSGLSTTTLPATGPPVLPPRASTDLPPRPPPPPPDLPADAPP
jgi:hypothetical protein